MTYLLALLAGIVGAVAGYAGSAILASVIAALSGMSNFEGAVGFFAFLGVGPVGGIIGLIAGVWLALRWRGLRGAAIAGRGVAVVAAIGVLAIAALGVLYLQRDLVTSNALPPQLVFEIRLPAGAAAPANKSAVSIDLDTDKNRMPASLADNWLRTENDRPIIAGAVELYYRTSQRILVLRLANQPARLFTLRLKASPAPSDAYSAWQRVDFVDDAESAPRRAGAADAFEIRYRVEDRSQVRMEGIDFEIRLPEGTPLPQESSGVRVTLRTDSQDYDGSYLAYDWRRQDGARTVLIGGMGIPDPAAHPRIVLVLPGVPARVFTVTLPASSTLGSWRQADLLEDAGQSPPRADQAFEIRYAKQSR